MRRSYLIARPLATILGSQFGDSIPAQPVSIGHRLKVKSWPQMDAGSSQMDADENELG